MIDKYGLKKYQKYTDDDFPFYICGFDLEGNLNKVKCSICDKMVIAYYEFHRMDYICPICMHNAARKFTKMVRK